MLLQTEDLKEFTKTALDPKNKFSQVTGYKKDIR